ncbi:MAG: hypothetical protein KGJ79_11430 [Alphaproteobacteria bacterium]|nr:hypothetical protein [Alphaproteobacteria bacterium]MDE2111743.1 hypothetical protein [Alphaproteobacteria bacterium]MDE2494908.1 hypothetical protein [Alphaproteobacteria bacterium]
MNGDRIVPADIGGGVAVDLSHILVEPLLVPDRQGRHVKVAVQGVEFGPADPPCTPPDRAKPEH